MDRFTTQDDLQAGARWAPALRALGDERLARMVEGGSDPAFTAIYGRYAPVLHGYCRSLLRDDEEAGDALQNAMLKALQAMRRAGRSGPLRPWLFRIAHNESVTIIRARSRRPAPLEESMVAGADDAFARAAAREQLAALLEDMQHLTEHQRGALVMRELGGLTYDEIGVALETTPLAARQAVFVARKRLRDGVVAPRRLRPALRQLIPAPGFALFGLFGSGGAAFSAGKAMIGTAAAVSVGIGSVELAVQPPEKHAAKATVAAVAPKHRSAKKTPPRPAATPTPAAKRVAAAPKLKLRTVATTTTTAQTQATAFVIKTHAKAPARVKEDVTTVSDDATTPAADRPASGGSDHHRPAVAPAPTAPTPAAPTAAAPAAPASHRPAYGGAGGRPTYSGYSAAARDGHTCPAEPAAADDTASPSTTAVPAVQ